MASAIVAEVFSYRVGFGAAVNRFVMGRPESSNDL